MIKIEFLIESKVLKQVVIKLLDGLNYEESVGGLAIKATDRGIVLMNMAGGLEEVDFPIYKDKLKSVIMKLQMNLITKESVKQKGKWKLDTLESKIFYEGKHINLTDTETKLIQKLWEEACSEEDLLRCIGYKSGIETQALKQHIQRLRKKLDLFQSKKINIIKDSNIYELKLSN